ncbi:hypothetical protein B0J12DRAFT_553811, partial [Macrophomina phaseolina]
QYAKSGGTENMARHLGQQHKHGKNGPIKKRRIEEFMQEGETAEQAFHNRRVESFRPQQFKRSLVRWVAITNIPFSNVETEPFRRMMTDANANLQAAGCLPVANTMKSWAEADFKIFRSVA